MNQKQGTTIYNSWSLFVQQLLITFFDWLACAQIAFDMYESATQQFLSRLDLIPFEILVFWKLGSIESLH